MVQRRYLMVQRRYLSRPLIFLPELRLDSLHFCQQHHVDWSHAPVLVERLSPVCASGVSFSSECGLTVTEARAFHHVNGSAEK